MSRMLRASLCSVYFQILQFYLESLEKHEGVDHFGPALKARFMNVLLLAAGNVVLNKEFLAHFEHPQVMLLLMLFVFFLH